MTFVNPYTFIRFPEKVIRKEPLGHAPTRKQALKRYTGRLEVTWTLKSPLAIPNDGSWGLVDEHDTEVRIPGASVKGAVRSLHEALFAGCARVMDPMFTPVYRDMMTTDLLNGWQLAVIISVDTNAEDKGAGPVKVVLCDDVSWSLGSKVKEVAQKTVSGARVIARTGDFIDPGTSTNNSGRNVNLSPSGFEPMERGPNWGSHFVRNTRAGLSVILVTDTAARDSLRPYYWATAKPSVTSAETTTSALGRFRQRLRGANRTSSANGFEDVKWPPRKGRNDPPGATVASRRVVDGWLRQGDVVWVRVDPDDKTRVTDIKLSLGWRVPARGRYPHLSDRVPQAVKPCSNSTKLCLSCSVFGSIDPNAKSERDGSQQAYGGHLRFGDLLGTVSVATRDVELAPLGTPHPGAGMFYLTPVTHRDMKNCKERPDFPSHWDSKAGEIKGKRDLRGRKFYWHSDPETQKTTKGLSSARYLRQAVHENDQNVPVVHLVEAGEFSQVITFDGLDGVSLVSLIATLNPALALGGGDYALHLGRGKPLGLGSVQAEVQLRMTTTAERYSEQPSVLSAVPDMKTELTAGVIERCGNVQQVWQEARTVLAWTGLGSRAVDVGYPTTKPWSSFGTAEFHQSFMFFQENSGQVRKNQSTKQLERGNWKPLPLPTEQQGQD